MRSTKLSAFLAALTITASCLEGGANNGGIKLGNKDGGHVLALGEIAIDPSGRYFFSLSGQHLVIGDLETRRMQRMEDLPRPDLVAFWEGRGRSGIFILSWVRLAVDDAHAGLERIVAYDLEQRRVEWSLDLERTDGRIDVAPDGRTLVVSNLGELLFLDAQSGAVLGKHTALEQVRDLDPAPDGRHYVLTEDTVRDAERRPTTRLTVLEASTARTSCELVVPNCSSELVLTQEGRRGFLAPTRCGRDPVSVVDLDRCAFEGNLPGFGPVALSPGGETVVAFMDRDAMDPEAPPIPAEVKQSADRYHLMFIDVASLEYTTRPIGQALPRYAFTPDGQSLLVDYDDSQPQPVVILDIEAKSLRVVQGDIIDLDQYALTPDAQHAFVLDSGLYDLDIPAARVDRVELGFSPVSLNMSPDGKLLLLKASLAGEVYVYSVEQEMVQGKVDCGAECQPVLGL